MCQTREEEGGHRERDRGGGERQRDIKTDISNMIKAHRKDLIHFMGQEEVLKPCGGIKRI